MVSAALFPNGKTMRVHCDKLCDTQADMTLVLLGRSCILANKYLQNTKRTAAQVTTWSINANGFNGWIAICVFQIPLVLQEGWYIVAMQRAQ